MGRGIYWFASNICGIAFVAFCAAEAYAAPLLFERQLMKNPGFDDGFDHWALSTTPNGTLGTPTIVPFETVAGTISDAARFQVGAQLFDPTGAIGGGSISQSFEYAPNPGSETNRLLMLAKIAVDGGWNQDFGTLIFVVNDEVVRTTILGPRAPGTVRTQIGLNLLNPAAGTYDVELLLGRNFVSGATSPVQYVDNFSATHSFSAPIPLPAAFWLFGSGIVSLIGLWFRGHVTGFRGHEQYLSGFRPTWRYDPPHGEGGERFRQFADERPDIARGLHGDPRRERAVGRR